MGLVETEMPLDSFSVWQLSNGVLRSHAALCGGTSLETSRELSPELRRISSRPGICTHKRNEGLLTERV